MPTITTPPFVSNTELAVSGSLVAPGEDVDADSVNRGHNALSKGTDYLALLQRVHQSLTLASAPRMTWSATSASLTLESDLTLRYVVDLPGSSLAVTRTVVLRRGVWSFGAGNEIMLLPLVLDGSADTVTFFPNGTSSPAGHGGRQYLTDEAAAQQFLRSVSAAQGQKASLRYIVLARRAGTSLQLLNRHVLRTGVAVENLSDEGYSGEAQVVEIKALINRDRAMTLVGGGQALFTQVGASAQVITTAAVRLLHAGGRVTTIANLTTGVLLTPANPVLICTVSRTASTTAEARASNWSDVSAAADNQVVLGAWDLTENIFRWRDGSGFRFEEQYAIGLPHALSATYLIEIITDEFVYPSDAAAHASLTGMTPTDRLAFVVTGTDREVVRPVTQDSVTVSGPAGAAVERVRAKGVRVEEIEAALLDPFGRPSVLTKPVGGLSAVAAVETTATDFLEPFLSGEVLVQGAGGVGAGVLKSGEIWSSLFFHGLEMKLPAAMGDTFTFREYGGADNVSVDSQNVAVEEIWAKAGSVAVRGAGGVGLSSVVAAYLNAYRLVTSGTGTVSGFGHVATTTAGVDIRDVGDTSFRFLRASALHVSEIELWDTNTLSGSSVVLSLATYGTWPGDWFVESADGLSAAKVATDIVTPQSGGTVRVRVDAGTYADIAVDSAYIDDAVRFGTPEAPAFGALHFNSAGTYAVVEAWDTGLGLVGLRANRLEIGTLTNTDGDLHLSRVSSRQAKLADAAGTNFSDLRLGNVRARNTPYIGTVLYTGGSWTLTPTSADPPGTSTQLSSMVSGSLIDPGTGPTDPARLGVVVRSGTSARVLPTVTAYDTNTTLHLVTVLSEIVTTGPNVVVRWSVYYIDGGTGTLVGLVDGATLQGIEFHVQVIDLDGADA